MFSKLFAGLEGGDFNHFLGGTCTFFDFRQKFELLSKKVFITVADLPTPKSEKTGGGPKKIWRLGKKPGGFGKMSHDLII